MENKAYLLAKEEFAALGIDTEAAIETLKNIPISIHCWQGDDVVGFDGAGSASGGIQTTGNYMGRARTPGELMDDIRLSFSLMPGKKRLTTAKKQLIRKIFLNIFFYLKKSVRLPGFAMGQSVCQMCI